MMECLSADILTLTDKVTFFIYGLAKKIMSYADNNFISGNFTEFYKVLNIEQAVSLASCQQSNRKVEASVKLIK